MPLQPMDLEDPKRYSVVKGAPADRGMAPDEGEPEPSDAESAEETRLGDLHNKLMSWYRQELDRQSDNRFEQTLDEDYYDGIQLNEEELQTLNERGQPPIVYNVLAQSINWICGTEKRGRTDFKILPRGKEDTKPAERKTKYMKYLSDVNRITFHRSKAFEEQVKVGIGWLECGFQDEDDGEPIYERAESWRNVLWDSAGSKVGQDDWRYMFRSRWVDEDVALAMFEGFKGAKDKIERAVQDSTVIGGYDLDDGDLAMDQAEAERDTISGRSIGGQEYKRRRVRLIQAEYRLPEKVQRIRGGAFNGQVFDERDPRHVEQRDSGVAMVVEKVMMRMRWAVMTPKDILFDAPSIYRHNTFSLTPQFGYIRGRDGMPYGVVRQLRPIQDGVNKRASKALHILSTNKTLLENGALADDFTPEDFINEVARPDGIIRLSNGGLNKIQLNVDRGMDQSHMQMMSHDIGMIQQVGGVTDELLGQKTNATSGVAIQARQEQGSLATSTFFDNLRLAVQMHGEKVLSLVEQFATEEKQFRITNTRGTPEFVEMNDGLPENDITRSKADFVVSESDWRATMRQAATAELTELLTKMPPQVAMGILDLLIDEMDINNRDEMVKRIRAMNGGKDPDQTEPTQEEIAAQENQAKQAQLQEAQVQLGMAEQQASIKDKEASAAKKLADVDVARATMVNLNMTAANSAMSAATQVVQMPTIAKIGDNLLVQGGWANGLPVPTNLPPAPQQLPQAAPQLPIPPQAAPAPVAPPQ